jgi:hypothetical protein
MLEVASEASERRRNDLLQKSRSKPRVISAQVLPSDRFPFPVHLDLFKRFVTLTRGGMEAVDASRVVGEGVPAQAGSLNVRFFKSINLLISTDRGLYQPAPELTRFVTARTVSDERARPILRALMEPAWFVSVARAVLSPKTAMTDGEFLGELALAAQTDRERKEPALRVLMDYMIYTGIILRSDGSLLLGSMVENTSKQSESSEKTSIIAPSQLEMPSAGGFETGGSWHTIQTEDFNLRIRSDLDAFDDLLEHLQTLKRKIERMRNRQQVAASALHEEDNSTDVGKNRP